MVSASVRAIVRSDTNFWRRTVDFDEDVIYGRPTATMPQPSVERPFSIRRKPIASPTTSNIRHSDSSTSISLPWQPPNVAAFGWADMAYTIPELPASHDFSSSTITQPARPPPPPPKHLEPVIQVQPPCDGRAFQSYSSAGTSGIQMHQEGSLFRQGSTSRPKLTPLRTNLDRYSTPPPLIRTFDHIEPQLIHPDDDEDSSSESDMSCKTPTKNYVEVEDPLTAKIDSAIEELSQFQVLTRVDQVHELAADSNGSSMTPSVVETIARLRFMMQADYSL